MIGRSCEASAYSVLMSAYAGDHAVWLTDALESMTSQTLMPSQIVLVLDGPVGQEIERAVECFEESHPGMLRCVRLAQNVGTGPALNAGLPYCSSDIVMRMDSDDLSCPERCEAQMKKLAEGFDMVGCNVTEFSSDPMCPNALRVMPETNEEIVRFGKRRAPFVHPTFAVRRSALEAVGGYRSVPYAEDFDLFARLLTAGYRGYNVQEPLLRVRVDEGAYRRRGGFSYLRDMLKFNALQLREGWFSPNDFLVRSAANAFVALMPNALRDGVYKRLLRKRS